MIGGYAVHIDGLLRDAAKEVPAADDDGDLAAQGVNRGNLLGDLVDKHRVDTETASGCQGFA